MNEVAEIEIFYKSNKLKAVKVENSQIAYDVLLTKWNSLTIEFVEEFYVILLNNSNEVLGVCSLFKGGITQTVVDIRVLFGVALKSCSVGIITAHNHPSGNLKPSRSDKIIHQKIKEAGDLLDIRVLDNLIITKDGYYSFKDNDE